MLGNLANLAVWLLVAACIVAFGWEEPLRYRFMSRASVAEEEKAFLPPATPTPDYRSWATPKIGGSRLGNPSLGGNGLKLGTPRGH
jgi:hypothetical protein